MTIETVEVLEGMITECKFDSYGTLFIGRDNIIEVLSKFKDERVRITIETIKGDN